MNRFSRDHFKCTYQKNVCVRYLPLNFCIFIILGFFFCSSLLGPKPPLKNILEKISFHYIFGSMHVGSLLNLIFVILQIVITFSTALVLRCH